MSEELIHIDIEHLKKRIKQMKPNADMNEMQFAFFEGYCTALKWVLDE